MLPGIASMALTDALVIFIDTLVVFTDRRSSIITFYIVITY